MAKLPKKKRKPPKKKRKSARNGRKLPGKKGKLSPAEKKLKEKAYHEHFEQIFKLVYRIVLKREDAEDITQEVFLRLWQGEIKEIGGLYTAARYLSYSLIAAAIRRRRHLKRLADLYRGYFEALAAKHPEIEAFAKLQAEDLADLLLRALLSLSEKNQDVIVLHYLQGYSVEEIAERLNLKVEAVKTRLYRARKHLKAFLLESGWDIQDLI